MKIKDHAILSENKRLLYNLHDKQQNVKNINKSNPKTTHYDFTLV